MTGQDLLSVAITKRQPRHHNQRNASHHEPAIHTPIGLQKFFTSRSAHWLTQSARVVVRKGSAKQRESGARLSPLLSGDKSKTKSMLAIVAGTSPGIFSRSRERLSLPPGSLAHSEFSAPGALLPFFPCVSIRLVRRPDHGLLNRPSPPHHGARGAAATFSSLSSNLPGAGPRPISCGRTSPYGGLHEDVSHQGHPKCWDCRPRRHRQDATGVVVALHRGHDPALGKSCGR